MCITEIMIEKELPFWLSGDPQKSVFSHIYFTMSLLYSKLKCRGFRTSWTFMVSRWDVSHIFGNPSYPWGSSRVKESASVMHTLRLFKVYPDATMMGIFQSVSLSCELHIYFCIHVEMSSVEHRKYISECLLPVVFIWEYRQVTVPLESVWGHFKQLEDECVYDLLYSSYKLAKEELRSGELKKKVKKLIKWLSASQPCWLCCLGY